MFIFLKSSQKGGFFIPGMTHSEKKNCSAYLDPDQLIVELQMQVSL
jgi:hypothetical protein